MQKNKKNWNNLTFFLHTSNIGEKNMKKHDQDFLTAIYQNALTACRSINNVISKVKAEQLKSELANQITLFSQISADCDNLANELNIKLKDLNLYEKSSMWFKINMATLFDKTCRNIASITILGNTMGVVDLLCVMSDCQGCNPKIMTIANKLKTFEEESINNLKVFLNKEYNRGQKDNCGTINKNTTSSSNNTRQNTKSKKSTNSIDDNSTNADL